MAREENRARERNGKRILLVDDDREIVSSMRAVLEAKGFDITTASDGNAGLAAVQRDRPDLMVVDMMMPKKSGFLVIEQVRQMQKPPRIIMITANEGNRHRAYAEMLGVDVYLRKPFAMEVLLEEVDRLTK
jgi:DNA-binding response OmpR family regulator